MDVLTQPIRNKIERLFEKDYRLTFYERFQYNGLCVRVTGYSAYFVQMGQTAQEELIQRTEHGVG